MSEPLEFDESVAADPVTRPSFDPEGEPERVRLVVKVAEPGYVPAGFEVRTRIDDVLFTAEAEEEAVAAAAADPQVQSMERARGLHPS